MTRAPPVAQGGMEANIGAKKIDTKNRRPVTTAVMPVFPPSTSLLEQRQILPMMLLTCNASRRLDESRDRTGANKSAHGDRERINTVGDSRVFEIKGMRVSESSEFGHRVQGTSGICQVSLN